MNISIFFAGTSLAPESIRWLYLKGRSDEADHIVRKIAKVNKVAVPEKINITTEV